MTGSSPSTSGHSNAFLTPYTSILSRYCRATSKSERMMRALTSELRNLMWHVSTANGELYWGTKPAGIVPDPKHDTYPAPARVSARHGPTQCVAWCIGGRPGQ